MKGLVFGIILATFLAMSFGACAPPETVTAPPAETAPAPVPPAKTEGVIKDLATISIMTVSKNWDADAEDDGIAIDIMYNDSKGQSVRFSNMPVNVTIELYGYRSVADTFDHKKMEFLCKTQVTVDHSMSMSEMFGNYIRIPFESMPVDRSKYYEYGTMKVIVTTPSQGDFEAIEDCVMLYPEG